MCFVILVSNVLVFRSNELDRELCVTSFSAHIQRLFRRWFNLENLINFFSVRVSFHRHWRFTGQQGKGGDHLFLSTTSTSSRTIPIFICNFACEMTTTYFYSHRLQLSDCYSMSNWWCNVNFCLFTWWFNSRFSISAIRHRKPVDLNSYELSPLF